MKLNSLIRADDRLIPAEVEVLLLPGLPAIHVLGLPDQVIKESLHRIRSALRAQGFEWPKARQVLVNIRPVDRRKSSRGLELAIAAGLLWETGQKPAPASRDGFYVYGELTLSGEILEPEDLARDFRPAVGDVVLTGRGGIARGFARDRASCLAELNRPVRDPNPLPLHDISRPEGGLKRFFTSQEARLISVCALGECHLLLAGASGTGKTTIANSLLSFLRPPNDDDLREGRVTEGWRPWIAPHHTVSALSLIGGGVPPRRGEISRADGGILFLDELLEFPPSAQEALREPVETGKIRVSRGMRAETFPAKLQLVGTTNLCPCGRWSPGKSMDCGHSWKRCRSTLEKISGPFFDRFDLLAFPEGRRAQRTISGFAILEHVERGRTFRSARLAGGEDDPWASMPEPWLTELKDSEVYTSERRRLSTLRVARVLADLDESDLIQGRHVDEAQQWTLVSFERLRATAGV